MEWLRLPDLSQSALLIVDVQAGSFTPSQQRGFDGVEGNDQRAYLDQLSETAAKFRQQGRPVIWVTVSKGSDFIRDHGQSANVKNADQLEEMGWFGGPPPHDARTQALADDFHDFSAKDGPQQQDTAVMKKGFNTFNPNEGGTAQLLKYLEEKGVKNIAIAGGNADVCVTATALGAATNGYNVTVLSDQLLSDDNAQRTKLPQQYENEMKDRLDKVAAGALSINEHLSGEELMKEGIDLTDKRIAIATQKIQTETSLAFFELQSPNPMQDYQGSSHGRRAGLRQTSSDPGAIETRPLPGSPRPPFRTAGRSPTF
jgi:nicotinamidase-related amidase